MEDNKRTITIIPAEPGWKVVEPVKDGHGEIVELFDDIPVVAWCVSAKLDGSGDPRYRDDVFLSVEPVVATASRWTGDNVVLRDPAGKFRIPEIQDVATEEDVIKFFKEQRG